MAVNIGVIAEERNDIDVLYEFTCKLVPENSFSFSSFAAHGCGRLRNKCRAWSNNLIQRGCTHLVVIHDLDSEDQNALRAELDNSVRGIGFSGRIILIPVFEIEAWLLSDSLALKQTFHMKKLPNIPQNPETIPHPKEYLRDTVWKYSKKHYVNTIHNKKIASVLTIDKALLCSSFAPYPPFLSNTIATC
jgi:hypothetical protein